MGDMRQKAIDLGQEAVAGDEGALEAITSDLGIVEELAKLVDWDAVNRGGVPDWGADDPPPAEPGPVRTYSVIGKVEGSKYLGDFEATSPEEAVEKAITAEGGPVSLCHQCSSECEDGEVHDASAQEVEG